MLIHLVRHAAKLVDKIGKFPALLLHDSVFWVSTEGVSEKLLLI